MKIKIGKIETPQYRLQLKFAGLENLMTEDLQEQLLPHHVPNQNKPPKNNIFTSHSKEEEKKTAGVGRNIHDIAPTTHSNKNNDNHNNNHDIDDDEQQQQQQLTRKMSNLMKPSNQDDRSLMKDNNLNIKKVKKFM